MDLAGCLQAQTFTPAGHTRHDSGTSTNHNHTSMWVDAMYAKSQGFEGDRPNSWPCVKAGQHTGAGHEEAPVWGGGGSCRSHHHAASACPTTYACHIVFQQC
jgi:hypothetical protein